MAAFIGRKFETENESLFIGDVAVSQQHQLNGKVTSHPVEDGSQISDHVIHDPVTLTVSMEVSNHPICLDPLMLDTGFAASGSNVNNSRIANAFDTLSRIKNERRIFNFQTGLRYYQNMVIESVGVTQNAPTRDVLRFSATLKQVEIVNSETIAIQRPESPNLGSAVNRGAVAPKTVSYCEQMIDPEFSGFEKCKDCEATRNNNPSLTSFSFEQICLASESIQEAIEKTRRKRVLERISAGVLSI